MTISRNEFINNIKTDYAPLNPAANEQPIPQGIKPLDVVKNATMESPSAGITIMQRPPGQKNADPNTLGTPQQTMESYTQPYEKNLLTNLPKNSNTIYYQFPLVELGVVIFNSNDFDKIANQ